MLLMLDVERMEELDEDAALLLDWLLDIAALVVLLAAEVIGKLDELVEIEEAAELLLGLPDGPRPILTSRLEERSVDVAAVVLLVGTEMLEN